MTYSVRRRAQANEELLEHVDRIAADNPDAALRFIDALEKALAHLSEHPEMGAPYEPDDERLAGIRKWVLPAFPNYVIFYRFTGQALDLLHILRAQRDQRRILSEEE